MSLSTTVGWHYYIHGGVNTKYGKTGYRMGKIICEALKLVLVDYDDQGTGKQTSQIMYQLIL